MNKKKIEKILSICMVTIILILTISTFVSAIAPGDIKPDPSVQSNNIHIAGNRIVAILQTFGVVLSVVILIVIGIKYMMGSAEEKAEYKKTFMPYIIGAALIFAASLFAQVVYDFFMGLGGNP